MAVVLTIVVRLQTLAVPLLSSGGLLNIFKKHDVYELVPNTTNAS
jgi:hypothetical protein